MNDFIAFHAIDELVPLRNDQIVAIVAALNGGHLQPPDHDEQEEVGDGRQPAGLDQALQQFEEEDKQGGDEIGEVMPMPVQGYPPA